MNNSKIVLGLFLCSLLFSGSGEAVGATWQQTGGPAGGNIAAVALAPGDVHIVYAGGRGGTVFRSTDGDQNSSNRVDFWSFLHHSEIDYPTNENIVYSSFLPKPFRLPVNVTTHPKNSKILYAVNRMQGLYKTENGGQSWSDLTAGGTTLPLDVSFIDLVIDPGKHTAVSISLTNPV